MQFSLSPQEENWDPSLSYSYEDHNPYVENDEAPPNFVRRPTDMLRTLANYSEKPPLDLHESDQMDDYWEDEDEDDEARFVNFSLLSHIAMQLRDKVPRGTHVKGSIPYPRAFTGKDIVVCGFLFIYSHPFSGFLHLRFSPLSKPKSKENWQSTMEFQRTTGEWLSKLPEACKASCSFMKLNGAVVSCGMVSKMCTCFWTTRKAGPMPSQSERSCPLE